MNTKQLVCVLGGLVGSLAIAACDLDVPDLNNPALEDLEDNPNVANVTAANTGLLIGNRAGKSATTGYVNALGILGREALDFDGADTRFVTEYIQGGLNRSSPFGGAHWAGPYANIRQSNIILKGVDRVGEFSAEEKSAIKGFNHTIQALELLTVINTRDDIGAVIDVDHPLGEALGPIVPKAMVFAEIVRLLDLGKTELVAAGTATAFPFPLSGGYAGFNTPPKYLTFNRAVRARVAVYQKDYAAALTALSESFLNDTAATIDFKLGVYYSYSLKTGDATNALINANIYAHPKQQTEAQMNGATIDARYTAKVAPAARPGTAGGDPSLMSNIRYTKLYAGPEAPVPLIRNEELILLKAEALWFSGPAQRAAATTALNLVRVQSGGLLPITEPADDAAFTDALLYERRYSLMFEGGHRWIDLRRFGRQLPLDAPAHRRNIRFPIPLAECDARPNEPACELTSFVDN